MFILDVVKQRKTQRVIRLKTMYNMDNYKHSGNNDIILTFKN